MADVKPRIKLDKKQAKKGDLVEVKALVSQSWRRACARTRAATPSRARS